MSSLLHILCALLAAVASGYALNCTECLSTSESCIGLSVTCPSGSQCGATLTSTETSGNIGKSYAMSCMPQDQCSFSGSATIGSGIHIKMGISCCSTERCIPSVPTLPSVNTVSNGLICRYCFSANSTWCYTSDTMQCTGDENMCLLQTSKISGAMSASTAMRGCATKSLCDLGSQSSNANGISADIKFICTSGSADLRKGFFLPAVICLFFLKLLI